MGQPVRFDGTCERGHSITDDLGRYVAWVAVCPEVGAGMGVPRSPLRLVGSRSDRPNRLRLVTIDGADDVTDAVAAYSRAACEHLANFDLCGFVFKSGSPTCGMERVRVYDNPLAGTADMVHEGGVGLFAEALHRRLPDVPTEQEDRLGDPVVREAFLDAVFAYARWQDLLSRDIRADILGDFHRRNKYLLRTYSPAHRAELDQLVAQAGRSGSGELRTRYGSLYMDAFKTRATPARHAETMYIMAGHLQWRISVNARRIIHEAIEDYCDGLAPRRVPITLLRHYAREKGILSLSEQSYIDPYPKPLRPSISPGGVHRITGRLAVASRHRSHRIHALEHATHSSREERRCMYS